MCRAQGIPHQRVTTASGLKGVLEAAWGLNRHSVVEVTTQRDTNVELHRSVQKRVARAVQTAYRLMTVVPEDLVRGPSSAEGSLLSGSGSLLLSSRSGEALAPPLAVSGLSWTRFELPLVKPLTTVASSSSAAGGLNQLHGFGVREGLLVSLSLRKREVGHRCLDPIGSGVEISVGSGEVSPLPGLHRESLEEAEQQLALVSELLRDRPVPRTIAMLGGRLGLWLRNALGFDPGRLHSSVRFGLESALLGALAEDRGMSLSGLLSTSSSFGEDVRGAEAVQEPGAPSPVASQRLVAVNGLISGASGPGGMDGAVAEAVRLVQEEGCLCLKVKVARK